MSNWSPATRVEFPDAFFALRHVGDSGRPSGQQLQLRDPQHRGRGAEGRGCRAVRPLLEHRGSDRGRLRHAAAPDRGGQPRHAARAERLHAVAGHPRGAGGGRRRLHARAASPSIPIACCSRRARPRASRSRSTRWSIPTTKCSCRCRPIRSTRRWSPRSGRSRCSTAPIPTTAGSPISITSRASITRSHAGAGPHRSQQPHRRGLSRARRSWRSSSSPSSTASPSSSDEVYGDLAYDGPVEPLGSHAPDAADHRLLVAVEGVPGARLARRLDGGGPFEAARPGAGRDQEARRRTAVQPRADAARDHRGAARRSLASAGVQRGAARARPAHRRSPQRHPGHALRDAAGRVLRDAAGDAAARTHRRGLRARPAARHGCPGGVRIGLRLRPGRRDLPRRVPAQARGTFAHLRRHRRLHRPLSRARPEPVAAAPKVSRTRPFSLRHRGAPSPRSRPESGANSTVCASHTCRSPRGTELDMFSGTMDVSAPLPTDYFATLRHLVASCTGVHPVRAIRQRGHHPVLPRPGPRRRPDLRRRQPPRPRRGRQPAAALADGRRRARARRWRWPSCRRPASASSCTSRRCTAPSPCSPSSMSPPPSCPGWPCSRSPSAAA